MKDITNPRLIFFKGALFLGLGIASAVLLFEEAPTVRAGILIAMTVWSFCRAYYFAFYVIEHYVDSNYRFSGLISFARYLLQKKHGV